MLQLMTEFLKPIVVNDAELGFDAISHVQCGGHFFGEPHTMERYEHAFYQPIVSNWHIAGGKDADCTRYRHLEAIRCVNTSSGAIFKVMQQEPLPMDIDTNLPPTRRITPSSTVTVH